MSMSSTRKPAPCTSLQTFAIGAALLVCIACILTWRATQEPKHLGAETAVVQRPSLPVSFLQSAVEHSTGSKIPPKISTEVIPLRSHTVLDDMFWKKGNAQLVYKNMESVWPAGYRYVVGWRPQIKKYTCPDGKEVLMTHHINVRGGTDFETCPDCRNERLIASYDKYATEYNLPDGYGIPVAPGEKVILETHYLRPRCWVDEAKVDDSGIDLIVTDRAPSYHAGLVGFFNTNMKIKPGQGHVDHVSRLTPYAVRSSLLMPMQSPSASFLGTQDMSLEIIGMHLHTHDLAKSKYFEILNSDGSLYFRSAEEPGGYGEEQQSFRNLKDKNWPRLRIQPGQTLQMHCMFDTDGLKAEVGWGLDHGDEMCAPLMVVAGSWPFARRTIWSDTDGFLLRAGRRLLELLDELRVGFRRLI